MTCDCSDPIVFGHHCHPPTFKTGVTFTITGGALRYTTGGTTHTIPLHRTETHWATPWATP